MAALPKPTAAAPTASPPRRISWLLCVPAVLIAACVLVGARLFLDVSSLSPRVLYSRVISSASLCAAGVPAGGVALEPWRATAQLNATRWQYVNVSLGAYPDGSPIKHYVTSQANVWGLAASQAWEAETFKCVGGVADLAHCTRVRACAVAAAAAAAAAAWHVARRLPASHIRRAARSPAGSSAPSSRARAPRAWRRGSRSTPPRRGRLHSRCWTLAAGSV